VSPCGLHVRLHSDLCANICATVTHHRLIRHANPENQSQTKCQSSVISGSFKTSKGTSYQRIARTTWPEVLAKSLMFWSQKRPGTLKFSGGCLNKRPVSIRHVWTPLKFINSRRSLGTKSPTHIPALRLIIGYFGRQLHVCVSIATSPQLFFDSSMCFREGQLSMSLEESFVQTCE
jgi:hypothetical protein